MITPALYGNAARYITGSYPSASSNVTPPARFLAGLVTAYNSLLGLSNLPVRRVNYYSGANQTPPNRLVTAGVVFVSIWGKNLAAFTLNEDWSTNKSLT